MSKLVSFVLVSLSLTACAVSSNPDGGSDPGPYDKGQANEALFHDIGVGESCHSNNGVTNGTMTSGGWCCGVSICNIKETCGKDYGHFVPSCANCNAAAEGVSCSPGALKKIDLGDGTKVGGVGGISTATSGNGTGAAPTATAKK